VLLKVDHPRVVESSVGVGSSVDDPQVHKS
jgi:hypothetical protein